jgi:hypothetical protein
MELLTECISIAGFIGFIFALVAWTAGLFD